MGNIKPESITRQIKLPLMPLREESILSDELPSLQTFFAVPILANSGYRTVFKKGTSGVEVCEFSDNIISARNSKPLIL